MISVISMLADPNGDSPANVDAAVSLPPRRNPSLGTVSLWWLVLLGLQRMKSVRFTKDDCCF